MMLWATGTPDTDVDAIAIPPMDKLLTLAESGPSSLRATALAALGKFDYGFNDAKVQAFLRQAATDSDPQIRLGALRGLTNAWRGDVVAPFLADKSEMVRLEAMRAAKTLAAYKLNSTETADALFDLMFAAPLNELTAADTHLAARDSLIAIATPAVAERAAKEFPALVASWTQLRLDSRQARDALAAATNSGDKQTIRARQAELAAVSATERKAHRNIRACARILGALTCDKALDQQIALLETESTDSPVLGDLIWSLGEIGDPKALPAIETFMTKSVKLAREYLQAQLALPPPYVPYSSEGTAQAVAALAKLDSPNWLTHAHTLVTMKVSRLRLDRPVDTALAMYDARYATASDADKATMQAGVIDLITDESHRRLARAHAMRIAGQWKLPAAVGPLTNLLTTERPSRPMMQMSAWA